MKRIQLKQIIREIVKEETSKGRRLNEAKSKLEEPTDELIKQYVKGKIPPYEMSNYGELYFNGPATLDLKGGELPFALGHCADLTIVNAGSFANEALRRCTMENLTIQDSPGLKSFKGIVGRIWGVMTAKVPVTSLKGIPNTGNGYYLETPNIKDFTGLNKVEGQEFFTFRCPGGSSLKSFKGLFEKVWGDFEITGATSLKSVDPADFPLVRDGKVIWKNNKMPLDPLDLYELTDGQINDPSRLVSDTKWDKKKRPLPKK